MKIIFRENIFNPGVIGKKWAYSSFLTPTPIRIDETKIRVFGGIRDQDGVSRIGWVDISAKDPNLVLDYSQLPSMSNGCPGHFDDNGVILGDVVYLNDELYLYYVGFQLVKNVKFLAFSGLAKSSDMGKSFTRLKSTPILDRCDKEEYIRAIHSAHYSQNIFSFFYAAGGSWEIIDGKQFPRYFIRQFKSEKIDASSPTQFRDILLNNPNEYRVGRPRYYKQNDFEMVLFTRGTLHGDYTPGVLLSYDHGENWVRKDNLFPLALNPTGFDSRHLCYPTLLEVDGQTWIFYNGNDMGKDGLCLAIVDANIGNIFNSSCSS